MAEHGPTEIYKWLNEDDIVPTEPFMVSRSVSMERPDDLWDPSQPVELGDEGQEPLQVKRS